MQDEEQEEGRALTGNKQKEGMDVNERKGGEKNKGGEKRDSTLGQSKPQARRSMAPHATHQQNDTL